LQVNSSPSADISVIIVAWNVREDLMRCLTALCSEDVRDALELEVIVVDNASTDGTTAAIRDFPVRLIENKVNVGYGRANNIGFRAARGIALLVMNPDTIPKPGSLTTLLRFANDNERAGIVAPRLLNSDGSVQTSAFAFPTLVMAALDLFPLPSMVPGRIRRALTRSRLNGRYSDESKRSRPFKIDHPLGACFLIKREAYEECGGFDEQIFMYAEEVDLALRYARAGWQCWQAPTAEVVHLGGRSTQQMPEKMFVELWRSRLYLYSKHYPPGDRMILRGLLRAAMWKDLAIGSVQQLSGTNKERASQTKARARGVLRMLAKR
jgi:N-acetylglucosaminyl-diphospho-decaprenol L-rhamnosyltransferase